MRVERMLRQNTVHDKIRKYMADGCGRGAIFLINVSDNPRAPAARVRSDLSRWWELSFSD
jgi:hypothetical protein